MEKHITSFQYITAFIYINIHIYICKTKDVCITGFSLLGLFLCDHLCLKEEKQAVNCLNWMMMVLFNIIIGFYILKALQNH